MQRLRYFVIDAFATEVFRGNPAGVCPLDAWLPDSLLQAIAAENNLSETAFFVPDETGYRLRWFTPTQEVPLCGHATLAAAFTIFTLIRPDLAEICFQSASGPLFVRHLQWNSLELNFPALAAEPDASPPGELLAGLGVEPRCILRSDQNYYVIVDSEEIVRAAKPNLQLLSTLHPRGVALSARGEQGDFVSRYFAPSYGIPEDPVTGSIHCALAPYWAKQLGKSTLRAHQASARGGDLLCTVAGDRVRLAGRAMPYLEGTIML
ncbi:MAG: PhzF family phenazine biosynthesis protein [Verrucomicrobiales bacterium]|nr:PhzF family phenazine biosynthesis protein [Verrucomicrobiales bacterium]